MSKSSGGSKCEFCRRSKFDCHCKDNKRNSHKGSISLDKFAKQNASHIKQLEDLGFRKELCIKALYRYKDVSTAADYLFHHQAASEGEAKPRQKSHRKRVSKSGAKETIDVQRPDGRWTIGHIIGRQHSAAGTRVNIQYINAKGEHVKLWSSESSPKLAPPGTHTSVTPGRDDDDDDDHNDNDVVYVPDNDNNDFPPPPPPPPQGDDDYDDENNSKLKVNPPKIKLEKGMYLDVRDNVGKWLEATIKWINVKTKTCKVHFLNWESKWDEEILYDEFGDRFMDFRVRSFGPNSKKLIKDQIVYVNPPIPEERSSTWIEGFVRKIDGPQVQVQFEVRGKRYQYWFHVDSSNEISTVDPATVSSSNVRSNSPSYNRESSMSGAGGEDSPKPYDDDNDENNNDNQSEQPKYWVGQYLEVKDTVGKWLPVEVVEYDDSDGEHCRIKIHYEGWSTKWDEYLDIVEDHSRIRSLGANIAESVEEKERKEEEVDFRRQLHEMHGFEIVEAEKDGNCLYRSVAHQIYNDKERHDVVRQMCCDYMLQNREFFAHYVDEDIDKYVDSRRQPSVWGDHVELVALREMFNKNLEVYDSKSIQAPKPLGLASSEAALLPIIRLSYHGQSHYNSLVDPKHPPPLGDGANAPVNLRELRLKSEEAEKKMARKPKEVSPKVNKADRRGSDIMRRKVVGAPKLTEADFNDAWSNVDTQNRGHIFARQLRQLVGELYTKLYSNWSSQLKSDGGDLRAETLAKAYDDGWLEIQTFADRLAGCVLEDTNVNTKAKKIPTQKAFLRNVAPDLVWLLNKGL